MNRSSQSEFRPSSRRRGVTLVEMLVTVAVLIIIMTILVQVFQAATGAMSAAQAIQQLDDQLRRLDGTLRSDLLGATTKFTPPVDPTQNKGYFEYGENEFADSQGEDTDDYIRFTAKAPPGQPFTGRAFLSPTTFFGNLSAAQQTQYLQNQPVTVTSEYAEIIYFLRNGNLYRRVLLVAPEMQGEIPGTLKNQVYLLDTNGNPTNNQPFTPGALGSLNVSWQGVNDLSARPSGTGPNSNLNLSAGVQAQQTIILNTLGALTNRENRFAYPRFANDYQDQANGNLVPDGLFDDLNQDNLPDVYPNFYPGLFPSLTNPNPPILIWAPNSYQVPQSVVSLLAFPYVFPGAYSLPQTLTSNMAYGNGWIHSPNPKVYVNTTTSYQYDLDPIDYLQNLNHNPLDLGDNLPLPVNQTGYVQTWWGFPTWRETLSSYWNDPTYQVNVNFNQPNLLTPLTNAEINGGVVNSNRILLPPMTSLWRPYAPQLFTDGLGDTANLFPLNNSNPPALWTGSWDDDLIMTGVRSFDIKAYDPAYAGYADLGWGDDLRLYLPYKNVGGYNNPNNVAPGLNGTPVAINWPPLTTGTLFNTLTQTFAHQGRIPPLVNDLVFDAHYGAATNYLPSNSTYLPANGGSYSGNVGDNNPGVVRLRRVWDSWSTDYSRAPGTAVNNTGGNSGAVSAGYPFQPPVYPSYPPPYQAPLRGIQIQIRVVDPSNQRIKSLTIVQDFTDKLF